MAERKGLGRGLTALMGDSVRRDGHSTSALPVDRIVPNPDQPRRHFSAEALEELARSLKTSGVLQPVLVRTDPDDPDKFQIIAGERRWRAAQLAGIHEVPVIIREISNDEVLEVAIIENIQRADLNALEEAAGYRMLMDRFGHTQERLAEALGKSRSHIANTLRLLSLTDEIRSYVSDGKMSAGHARALLTAPNPNRLARDVIKRGLSVRQTERLAKSDGKKKKLRSPASTDVDTLALQNDIGAALGMQVVITPGSTEETGTLMVRYTSLEKLDQLCQKLQAVSEMHLQ